MIYIDELLILNFIIDYVLLDFTSNILKINTTFIRKILGCLIGELSILYLFVDFNNITLLLFKLFIGIIIIRISFIYNDLKTFIKTLIYFYIFSFLLGGTLYYFKIENLIKYNYFLLFIPIIMNIYKRFAYDLKNIISIKYLNGLMDTGNNLIDPYTHRKVIIINKKVNENYILVPYKTISDSGLIKCFKPKKIYIDGIGERNDILVGITNKKFIGFNCLLNYKLMEDK